MTGTGTDWPASESRPEGKKAKQLAGTGDNSPPYLARPEVYESWWWDLLIVMLCTITPAWARRPLRPELEEQRTSGPGR